MGSNVEEGYMPPPEFQEDAKEPLLDLTSSDSTEFWLIQWPKNQVRHIHCFIAIYKTHYPFRDFENQNS